MFEFEIIDFVDKECIKFIIYFSRKLTDFEENIYANMRKTIDIKNNII